ncbi:MAG: nucleoside/nucleotide kinase family protein [Pseudobutyrivibrio ruminis]|uniref:Nucleoside/nucleotide kinase family protein n=1 Tax=Pseudobutyrivibrio ruminis TaxID=46206 RepID=A0A927YPV5_9FIRM|nr:nucleoside/nucleotide kinase family protein [Pseudobutyrivibrio ruminis]
MEYNACINGYDIQAHYSEQNIEEIFIPLLKRLTKMQQEKGRRILVMLAAPPGAGKSTLLDFLEHLSKTTEGVKAIQTIGMDGFHHYQDYLLSHDTVRDGRTIKLVEIKGAPITFDLEALEERIRLVASGDNCDWPTYDRNLHNPVENAIQVTADIVLLEGNYLLLDEDGWRNLSDYADYTIFISADEDLLRSRLVERKAKNTPLEQAKEFVEKSDMRNAIEVLHGSKKADLNLRINSDGEYENLI